jgi:Phospholipase_D-nuclease N-terminal
MELLSPEVGLYAWILFSFISLGLFLAGLLKLIQYEHLDMNTKLFWTLIILFVPTIGPMLLFALGGIINRKKITS